MLQNPKALNYSGTHLQSCLRPQMAPLSTTDAASTTRLLSLKAHVIEQLAQQPDFVCKALSRSGSHSKLAVF